MNGENKISVGKSHDQGSLERQGRREDNIKMNLRQTGHDCVDWAEVTQEEINGTLLRKQ
jgi:hypothetical protein